MSVIIKKLTPDMRYKYIDFFENRAFCDGNINKGCYCVWHHWTQKHEYERSLLPGEERPFCKRNYALKLIEQGRLNGFAAFDEDDMIGFCNADIKDSYFRLRSDADGEQKILAIVCFTVDPKRRGLGIAKKLLSAACVYACENGFDQVESYPADGGFDPYNCCGSRSMYESQGFEIVNVSGGLIARKKFRN